MRREKQLELKLPEDDSPEAKPDDSFPSELSDDPFLDEFREIGQA
jgi:hypothetical protein